MTQLSMYIDRIEVTKQAKPEGLSILSQGTISVEGWAYDTASSSPPVSVSAVIDDGAIVAGQHGIMRPDVAQRFGSAGLTASGFKAVVAASHLTLGAHTLKLRFAFANGTELETNPLPFEVAGSLQLPAMAVPRIFICASPKTGSTYSKLLLMNYYGIPNVEFHYDWLSEHTLTDRMMQELGDNPYVLQHHAFPREQNLRHIRERRIATVISWRNLADSLISWDDHIRTEGPANPFMYVGDRDSYLAMEDQARYQFLIRHAAPWYLAFYLAWRAEEAPVLMHYEALANDPMSYFRYLIERVSGGVDQERLRTVLGARLENSRYNKGVNGRAAALMSAATRTLLEELIVNHHEDNSELIEELPWRGGAQASLAAGPGSTFQEWHSRFAGTHGAPALALK